MGVQIYEDDKDYMAFSFSKMVKNKFRKLEGMCKGIIWFFFPFQRGNCPLEIDVGPPLLSRCHLKLCWACAGHTLEPCVCIELGLARLGQAVPSHVLGTYRAEHAGGPLGQLATPKPRSKGFSQQKI